MRTRAPLPWTSGVFDGDGLDDILQTIRVSYSGADNVGHVRSDVPGHPDWPRLDVGAVARRAVPPQQPPLPRAPALLSPLS